MDVITDVRRTMAAKLIGAAVVAAIIGTAEARDPLYEMTQELRNAEITDGCRRAFANGSYWVYRTNVVDGVINAQTEAWTPQLDSYAFDGEVTALNQGDDFCLNIVEGEKGVGYWFGDAGDVVCADPKCGWYADWKLYHDFTEFTNGLAEVLRTQQILSGYTSMTVSDGGTTTQIFTTNYQMSAIIEYGLESPCCLHDYGKGDGVQLLTGYNTATYTDHGITTQILTPVYTTSGTNLFQLAVDDAHCLRIYLPQDVLSSSNITTITVSGNEYTGTLELPATLEGLPVMADGLLANRLAEFTNVSMTEDEKSDFLKSVVPSGLKISKSAAGIKLGSRYELAESLGMSLPDGDDFLALPWRVAELNFSSDCRFTKQEFESLGYTDTLWWHRQPNGLVKISPTSFMVKGEVPDELMIQDGIEYIYPGAFMDMTNIVSVKLPASVKEISEGAFTGCVNIREVTIPEGLSIADVFPSAYCYITNVHPSEVATPPSPVAPISECAQISLTVTNVVVHYVLNSVQPEIVVPLSGDTGFVNVITEVVSGGAIAVPGEWKDNYPAFTTKFGDDFGKALTMKSGKVDGAGNAMFVWQDFVAGTDPTDADDKFTASITIVDGVPVTSYSPELPPEQKALRSYKTYGKEKLADADWVDITNCSNEERAGYNFFKVSVEMR